MIFWSDWGLLTAIFLGAGLGVPSALAADLGLLENLSVTAGLMVAALANFLLARWRDRQPTRELIDAQTGQRIRFVEGSSLFFVPVRYWAYLMLGFAALALVLVPARVPVRKSPPARAAELIRL